MDATLLSNAVDVIRNDMIDFLQKIVQSPSLPNEEHRVQNLIAQKFEIHGT